MEKNINGFYCNDNNSLWLGRTVVNNHVLFTKYIMRNRKKYFIDVHTSKSHSSYFDLLTGYKVRISDHPPVRMKSMGYDLYLTQPTKIQRNKKIKRNVTNPMIFVNLLKELEVLMFEHLKMS